MKMNELFKNQKRNCLILLDNAASHSIADMVLTKAGSFECFKMSNLLLLFMPANCTSVVQPLDQGIIAAFKARYKSKLAQHLIRQYDVNPSQDLRALSLTTDVKQVCSHSSLSSTTNYFNLFIGNHMALRSLV